MNFPGPRTLSRSGALRAPMVLWVGVDDTDSLRGMCTTFLATEIVRDLTKDFDLVGYPRLVRLNPNIPWKTRGNGALALRFGHGVGAPWLVGHISDRDILAYPRARGLTDPEKIRSRAIDLVERWSAFDDPTTNPACVILRCRPPASLYWKAVRGVVRPPEVRRSLRGLGYVRAYKNGRGVVGASAAVAWRPRDRTYEVIAYRRPSAWGTARQIDPASVRAMDQRFPTTFNNYDYLNDKVVIAPHSPCPVLFGIRGDDPGVLPAAMRTVRGEIPDRWLVFETNQGTDDHIRWNDWSLEPWSATSIQGIVASVPRTRSGGHVLFELAGRDVVTVAAYEPSKQFRGVVRSLRGGDRLRLWASVRDEPRTLNLEKFQLIEPAAGLRKVANPRCTKCGKSMKSLGRDAGYRCARCHVRASSAAAQFVVESTALPLGSYEPPACARRHLSKPLKRVGEAELSSGLLGPWADRGIASGASRISRAPHSEEHPSRVVR